ncbi:MAG TPA: AmmeMemoRadiSam system protein B, partial [Armatimonadota bacterium]|nr:AmmeMemoRadiSam system protein B [Armatimonadota bacterium]
MSDLENPRLRPIDVIPVQQGQQTVYVLMDRSGLQEEQVAVSGLGAAILPMLDGEHTIREIQVDLTRRSGQLVMSDHVEGILRQLDDAHLLDTPALEAYRQEKLADYRESGARRPRRHLGYPSEPDAFAEMTDSWMEALPPREQALDGSVVGALAPHIDFERGSMGYAHAYRDLSDACEADLFIIIGTDHTGDTQFAATRNDFETGLGRVKTAGDVLERMEERFIGDLFEGELQHVGEHAIEFQVVLLQHFIDHDFEIVPLLCGGFAEEMIEGEPELRNAEALCMVDVLRDVVENSGRKACIIASADLSHVG